MKLTWFLLAWLGVGAEENRKTSLVAYWGQNSYGASDGGGKQRKEHPLQDYCRDGTYDVLVMSFLTKFNAEDPNGFPELNLGDHCKGMYEGTNHPKCDEVAEGIKFCQKQGKRVLLSMGGFNGNYTIATKADADSLAYRMWGLYFGGTAEHRPFLDAVLDGIDLDIEKGPPENYAQFSTTMHNVFTNNFFNPSNRSFVVTAAPQCPFPDAHLKNTLENGWLDMVFVQFYNNPCGLGSEEYNLATWDGWARFASVNKQAKVYIGAPAAPTAATTGYMPHTDLKAIIKEATEKYPSFGGIMLWDVSQANMNLCPIEKKLFSVAISHTLKGDHNVSQPGALAPQEAIHTPLKTPNLQDMVPATLPLKDAYAKKLKLNLTTTSQNATTTASPVATKIEPPKTTAESFSSKPSAAPSAKPVPNPKHPAAAPDNDPPAEPKAKPKPKPAPELDSKPATEHSPKPSPPKKPQAEPPAPKANPKETPSDGHKTPDEVNLNPNQMTPQPSPNQPIEKSEPITDDPKETPSNGQKTADEFNLNSNQMTPQPSPNDSTEKSEPIPDDPKETPSDGQNTDAEMKLDSNQTNHIPHPSEPTEKSEQILEDAKETPSDGQKTADEVKLDSNQMTPQPLPNEPTDKSQPTLENSSDDSEDDADLSLPNPTPPTNNITSKTTTPTSIPQPISDDNDDIDVSSDDN
ncbi:Chitinase 2 [Entomophthora muscae]|uniref:Chitinase 2 n=1 Tax=Entomophthora muscae TaxID=34485 RepID=A0ACC2UMG3_9FUNG|nr:Chitinase 2 [Entomophthora muscae]